MSSSLKYIPNYTVADYQTWEGDWELIDGVAVSMGPSPFGSQGALLSQIAYELERAIRTHNLRDQFTLLIEVDWIVDDHTVVRPDLQIVQGPAPQGHVQAPPVLVAEILSPSTQEKDQTWKFDLYRRQGVLHYLLADPTTSRLEIHTLSQDRYHLNPPTPTYPLTFPNNHTLEVSFEL